MNMLSSVGNKLSNVTGKFGMKVSEHAPELLLVTGIVGFVGCVVLSCKATLQVEEVLDRHKEKMDEIHDGEEADEDYDSKRDKVVVYSQTCAEFVKLYAPAITVGAFSICCVLHGNKIMRRRYAGVMAAYTTVTTAFDEYRSRVREEGGEDLDRHYMFGSKTETVTREEEDENGKKKKVKEDVEVLNNEPSGYARVFDSSNPNWDRNTNFSMMFLKAQEEILNNLLQTRGHVFLNEVYDSLGFKHTQEGAMVGWRIGKDAGDEYIDFGLYNLQDENVRRFINGEDNVILLDFNVDGPIFNRI